MLWLPVLKGFVHFHSWLRAYDREGVALGDLHMCLQFLLEPLKVVSTLFFFLILLGVASCIPEQCITLTEDYLSIYL